MNPYTLRLLFLTIHISGLILMAGTSVTAFVVFRAFIRKINTNREASAWFLQLQDDLAKTFRPGGILMILSGIGLMWTTRGVYLHQVWLQIKLSLIVLFLVNEFVLGNPQMKRLKGSFSETNAGVDPVFTTAVSKLNIFYTVQLLIFLSIISLAIFKVN